MLAGRVCCISPVLLAKESDGGDGLRLVTRAALGCTGTLVDTFSNLSSVLEGRDGGAGDRSGVVICANGEAKTQLKRAVPKGCEVWTRAQFVAAVVQQSFVHQKAHLLT